MKKISIIIPVFNEEESLVELYRQIKDALEPSIYDFEILFIDDGSSDNSYQLMLELSKSDPRVIPVGFQRNHGKAAALNIGFKECSGDYVITMDGDLQDNPEEITELIDVINSGWDMVSGWKKDCV